MSLRSDRHRHRTRRLCRRHPRRATRAEGCRGGEARHPWRDLPQCRLHPVQGTAACERAFRRSRGRLRRHGHQGQAGARSRRHARLQGRGREGNVQGVEFLLKKNKIEPFHGEGRIVAPGKVEVTGLDGAKQSLGDQEHRHRHGLRRGGHPRHRHRRGEDRLLHRRAVAAQGAAAAGRDRRGLYRARARLGVAAARRAR